MTKEELRELATWGVRRKLQEIEQQLAAYHAEFPELFISETKPVLLRAEPREDGRPWGATPKPAEPRQSVRDRIVQYLTEHPAATARTLGEALGVSVIETVRTELYRLRKLDKVHQPLNDGQWMLREKYLALPASPSEPVDTRTQEQRLLDYLATRQAPLGMTATLRAAGVAISSGALYRLKKEGRVKDTPEGWVLTAKGARKASAPAGKATGSQPALPLAASDDGVPRTAGGRRMPPPKPDAKFWKEQWYVRLQQLGGSERLIDTAKAFGTGSANLATSARSWIDAGIIEKVGLGVYRLGKAQPAPGMLLAAAQALEGRQNGGHA